MIQHTRFDGWVAEYTVSRTKMSEHVRVCPSMYKVGRNQGFPGKRNFLGFETSVTGWWSVIISLKSQGSKPTCCSPENLFKGQIIYSIYLLRSLLILGKSIQCLSTRLFKIEKVKYMYMFPDERSKLDVVEFLQPSPRQLGRSP